MVGRSDLLPMVLEPQRDPVRSLVISVEILSARHRPHAAAAGGGRALATYFPHTALSSDRQQPPRAAARHLHVHATTRALHSTFVTGLLLLESHDIDGCHGAHFLFGEPQADTPDACRRPEAKASTSRRQSQARAQVGLEVGLCMRIASRG